MAVTSSSFAFLLFFIFLLHFSIATAIEGQDASLFTDPVSLPPLSSPQDGNLIQTDQQSFFTNIAILPKILSQLGFHELAMAAPSLSDASATGWFGPSTLFAPSDDSILSCVSCSVQDLLREHLVPGLFTAEYLRKLAFGTKIETLSPGRCITVTSDRFGSGGDNQTATSSKVFIGGVEITQPDLFNNGLVIVHGLQGFIAPLSPFSCDVERMNSLTFPFNPDLHFYRHSHHHHHHHRHRGRDGDLPRLVDYANPFATVQPTIMRLMLRDAMLRLRSNGFSILALALKVKYAELVNLKNMTVFAIDDVSIFSGSHSYISNVRFHIVPNILLSMVDLEKLPVGTILPTLVEGQVLVVTTPGRMFSSPLRINYVRIKVPELMRNLKIIVHGLFLPFPHITPGTGEYDEILGGGEGISDVQSDQQVPDRTAEGTCYPGLYNGDGGTCVHREVAAMPPAKLPVEIEDHHGL